MRWPALDQGDSLPLLRKSNATRNAFRQSEQFVDNSPPHREIVTHRKGALRALGHDTAYFAFKDELARALDLRSGQNARWPAIALENSMVLRIILNCIRELSPTSLFGQFLQINRRLCIH